MTRVKQAFGVFILLFAFYYGHLAYTLAAPASAQETESGGWVTSLDAGLAQGLAEHKPVLVDFWATWCKNCLVMDQTVLKDPAVIQQLDGYVKVKYQAEDPSAEPAKDVMAHYKVLGLPTYIVLHPAAR
jgi:thiol:disulfide interchange protein